MRLKDVLLCKRQTLLSMSVSRMNVIWLCSRCPLHWRDSRFLPLQGASNQITNNVQSPKVDFYLQLDGSRVVSRLLEAGFMLAGAMVSVLFQVLSPALLRNRSSLVGWLAVRRVVDSPLSIFVSRNPNTSNSALHFKERRLNKRYQ